jgi:hypothetical protein
VFSIDRDFDRSEGIPFSSGSKHDEPRFNGKILSKSRPCVCALPGIAHGWWCEFRRLWFGQFGETSMPLAQVHPALKYCRQQQDGQRQQNPRIGYEVPGNGMTLDFRARQLRDEPLSCGIEPAYIRLINRRFAVRSAASTLELL